MWNKFGIESLLLKSCWISIVEIDWTTFLPFYCIYSFVPNYVEGSGGGVQITDFGKKLVSSFSFNCYNTMTKKYPSSLPTPPTPPPPPPNLRNPDNFHGAFYLTLSPPLRLPPIPLQLGTKEYSVTVLSFFFFFHFPWKMLHPYLPQHKIYKNTRFCLVTILSLNTILNQIIQLFKTD